MRDLPDAGARYLIYDFWDDSMDKRRRMLSIRGTKNLKNIRGLIRTEFKTDTTLKLKIHTGFHIVYAAILNDYQRLIELNSIEDIDDISITGHSLGGAVGCLIGAALRTNGYNIKHITTFGMPKFTDMIGSIRMAFLLSNVEYKRVQHVYDPVGRVPLAGVTRDSYTHLPNGHLFILEPQVSTGIETNGDVTSRYSLSSRSNDAKSVFFDYVSLPSIDPFTLLQDFDWRGKRIINNGQSVTQEAHRLLYGKDAEERANKLFKDISKFSLNTHYMSCYLKLLTDIRLKTED